MGTKILLVAILFTAALLFPISSYAQNNFNQGEVVLLEKNQTISKDYFASGEKITLAGTVEGDAYVAGGNITIEGHIKGDLLTAGGTITMRGTVDGNIRAAGGTIIISGVVGKNITAAGGTITLTDSAKISGSTVLAGGTMELFAPIPKDATLAGGTVTMGTWVQGDVLAAIGELSLTPSASISGSLNYWSDQNAQIAEGATISGQLNHYQTSQSPSEKAPEEIGEVLTGLFTFYKIASFISALIIGLILIKLFPLFMQKTTETINTQFGSSFLVGLITVILIPIVILVLFMTLVGFPLALILGVIYLLMIYSAKIFAGFIIGSKVTQVTNLKTNIYLSFVLGLIIYYIISLIPFLGSIATAIIALASLGAYLLTKKQYYNNIKAKKIT